MKYYDQSAKLVTDNGQRWLTLTARGSGRENLMNDALRREIKDALNVNLSPVNTKLFFG